MNKVVRDRVNDVVGRTWLAESLNESELNKKLKELNRI